tara:strand:+ start:959 stop:1141 length:183 start_codon:yes stop_codon:yes gene_type:complete
MDSNKGSKNPGNTLMRAIFKNSGGVAERPLAMTPSRLLPGWQGVPDAGRRLGKHAGGWHK